MRKVYVSKMISDENMEKRANTFVKPEDIHQFFNTNVDTLLYILPNLSNAPTGSYSTIYAELVQHSFWALC